MLWTLRYLPNTDLYTILIASKQRLKTRPKPHRPLLCRKALNSITQIHNALENHTQFITMVNPFLTADEVLQEFQLTRLASYQKVRSNRQSSLESCKVNKLQGVPYYWAHFVFCYFLGFWCTYRGTSDLYSTALEICYIIATRILRIDSEIAEIIEVKVGTCHF